MAARIEPTDAVNEMLAVGVTPLVPYPGAKGRWSSKCTTCGMTVSPRLKDIRRGQRACRYCAGRDVDPEAAATIMRAAGLEPLTAYTRALAPWPSRCTTCHEHVEPRYADVRDGGGCRYCAGQTTNYRQVAVDTMRAAGYEPLTHYPGATRPWPSRCTTCHDQITPTYTDVQRSGHTQPGCRCNPPEPTSRARPTGVYLMTNDRLQAVKVGIGTLTAGKSPRVTSHQRHGWTLHAHWTDIPDRTTAQATERRILQHWTTEGIRGHVHRDDMPQAGWTETAPLHRVDLDALVQEITHAITTYSTQHRS